MKSLLDPTFKYTPAVATDVRATFERIRREQIRAAKPIPGCLNCATAVCDECGTPADVPGRVQ